MIRILLDSSADFSLEECRAQGFEMVSLHVQLNGREYIDGVDLGKDEFYELLQTGDFPRTSQPSPEDFLKIFEQAKQNGDELICILLSSSLSGTYQSALLAREMAEYDKIHIVDSLCASGAIRILADQAKKRIAEGLCAADIAEELLALRHRIRLCAALDTLEYLARGGRINKTVANIGSVLRLKPVVAFQEDGSIALADKPIGKVRAMQAMIERLGEKPLDPAFPLCTVYSNGEENVELFEKKLCERGFAPGLRTRIGAGIGAHIGPGAFGIIYVEA